MHEETEPIAVITDNLRYISPYPIWRKFSLQRFQTLNISISEMLALLLPYGDKPAVSRNRWMAAIIGGRVLLRKTIDSAFEPFEPTVTIPLGEDE